MSTQLNDNGFMAEAIQEAKRGLFTTRSNPRVGCVLVKDGNILSKGYHSYPGGVHAEIDAIQKANEPTAGATAYVTLEPCNHLGKTPPCAQALVEAGINSTVIAMQDPNPLVNGSGIDFLRHNKIDITTDVLKQEALELNKGFVKRVTSDKPYVTIKSALSMDGKVALASGESKWISGEASRKDVQFLRARSCAIMTGVNTILVDNPLLTVRLAEEDLNIEGPFVAPTRVIIDSELRCPNDSNIFDHEGKILIYTINENETRIANFQNENTEIIVVNALNDNVDLSEVMEDLAKREINEVLVEAGPTITGNLLENNLTDELVIYYAPHLMGSNSLSFVNLPSVENMNKRIDLEVINADKIGNDLKIISKPIMR